MRHSALLVPLSLSVAACAPPARAPSPDAAAERAQLLEVERGFSRESVEKGTATAFRDHLADDAVELAGGQPLHGREAIAKALEDRPGGPRSILEWAPEDAAVSGDLGYTWGRYTLAADGKARHGKYQSVWRRGPGGAWKVISDIGTPDTESPVAPPPAAPAVAPLALPATYDAQYRQLLEQLVAVDTSHGGETKLLEPVAALYRDAGVPVQILESAPGRGNLVARLKGSGAKKPMLLLAHVDVVPVEGQPWTVPAFAVTEKDGLLSGRGINDDKAMAAAIVASTLELARSHAPLARDVVVALTAGEETGGSAGVRWLVDNHKELLDVDFALNEGGGALLTDDFSRGIGVYVGVSEKVFQTFRLTVKGKGGHSSRPPTTGDPVVTLARALVKIGEHRFAPTVLPEAKADFASELGSAEAVYLPALRGAIASAPRISAADDAVLSKDAGYNAAIRTTCVTTMLKGSPQDNVLPTTAEASVNCRILPGGTREQVRAELLKVIGDPDVALIDGEDIGDGPSSPFDGEVVEAVKKAAPASFPGAVVAPGMGLGTTDSRHLRRIGIRAYGVSPNTITRAEARAGHGAHGPDERRPVKWLAPGGAYFREVVRTLAL